MPNAARPDGALLVHQVHPPLPQDSPCVHQPPLSPCHLSRSQITHILPLHISHNCLCQQSHLLFLPSMILMVLMRMRLVMMMMTKMVRKTKQAGPPPAATNPKLPADSTHFTLQSTSAHFLQSHFVLQRPSPFYCRHCELPSLRNSWPGCSSVTMTLCGQARQTDSPSVSISLGLIGLSCNLLRACPRSDKDCKLSCYMSLNMALAGSVLM